MLVFALEAQGGCLLGDDTLQVGDFFRAHVVIQSLELFLGTLHRLLGGLLVDFRFAKRHVGEDDSFVVRDFCETGTNSKSNDLSGAQVAQLAGLERSHETGVAWQDAHFTICSGQIDVLNGIRENLFLRCDDFEVK